MKKKAIFVIAIIACVFLAGCSALDSLQEWKNGEKEQTPLESSEQQDNLLVDLEVVTEDLTTDNSHEVILYFAQTDGKLLQKESRRILKSDGLAKSTIEELLKGPKDTSLKAAVPQGTTILSMDIKEGLCTADFSSHLIFKGSEQEEKLAVYSLVNTLTQFNSVDQVQIMVNGQKPKTLCGKIDISKPLEKNAELISE
ncbi:MAG: GerMN domain-containing protein [Bacillota bacterium]